jgi:hypothetical protein
MRWGEQELQTTLPHFLRSVKTTNFHNTTTTTTTLSNKNKQQQTKKSIPAVMLADKEACF